MARVYLIRHGRPAAAWGGDDDDPGLDETGATQARAVAGLLLALPSAQRPRQVVSSPLRRCRETAAPLAERLGVAPLIEPAVGEIPTPAGLAVPARPAWLRRAMAGAWGDIEGDLDYEAWRRAVSAAAISRPASAVFTHFVAINAVLSLAANDPRVIVSRPDHASITILEIGPGGPIVVDPGREAAATSVL